MTALAELLSDDEQQRASRLVYHRDRARFTAAGAEPQLTEAAAAEPEAEAAVAEAPAEGDVAAPATGAEGEDISMEDVLGAGTRKRPSAATEDVDELQAETRRF